LEELLLLKWTTRKREITKKLVQINHTSGLMMW
jgi:hypothetical protein